MRIKIKKYRIKKYTAFILGVKVDFINLKNALYLISKWFESNKQYQITTPNPEQIILCQSDYRLKKIINNSALSIADGIGLVWAAKLLETKFPNDLQLERLTGVDLMQGLLYYAAKKRKKVFLLGGKKGIAKKASQKIKKQIYALSGFSLMVDYCSGPEDIKKETKKERQLVFAKINKFKPQILFVAFGAPQQEKWLHKNLPFLKSIKVAMGVGGAFDILSLKIKRAPQCWQKLGLEWFWRLLQEPWRIKRQLKLVKFVFLVLKQYLRGKFK